MDQRLCELPEIVFNDIRPEASIAFDTGDFLALARPRLGSITA
ncbi:MULTISPECIES: hypothetical protein [unclassified Streptomyces]|nr:MULTISPECIES: hypothetical protein [unclassified Streptomyces]MCZ7414657.1 hypothetical protein [Streptomyces sp. WMMC897]MCZ7431586.1 hypothetical protein [Streptomyces sp. WMMC1477]